MLYVICIYINYVYLYILIYYIYIYFYSTTTTFTKDITSGNNNCLQDTVTYDSSTSQSCCSAGFNVTTGWDPVTGLGSVDYSLFSTIFPTTSRRTRSRSLRMGVGTSTSSGINTEVKSNSSSVFSAIQSYINQFVLSLLG